MLFRPVGTSKLQRIQGAFVTEDEIARGLRHWAAPGRARVRRGAARGAASRSRGAARRRALARPGRPARRRGADRGRVRDRVGLDDPAPAARRLHPRRPPDRHARAARDHLRLRGLEAPPGAGLGGRAAAAARAASPTRARSRAPSAIARPAHRDRARARRAAERLAQTSRDARAARIAPPWPPGTTERMRIGEVLEADPRRAPRSISAPSRSRPRSALKYLRALENEDWDVLPSPAYAKGFLRTYAQLLGLDARRAGRRVPAPGRGGARAPTAPICSASPCWSAAGDPATSRVGAGPCGRPLGRLVAVAVGRAAGRRADRRRTTSGKSGPAAEAASRENGGRERRRRRATRRNAGRETGRRWRWSRATPVRGLPGRAATGEALIDGQMLVPGAEEPFERRRQLRAALPDGLRAPTSSSSGWTASRAALPLRAGPAALRDQRRRRRPTTSAARPARERLPVSVRAGIVVTGTEVITGRITDRNGPWISRAARRAGGRGRPHPRRRRPRRGPRGGAAVPGRRGLPT